jgi:hypothetical protein
MRSMVKLMRRPATRRRSVMITQAATRRETLIEPELRDGRLLSIAGRHLRGGTTELVAARRRDMPHGPIAQRLWHYVEEQANAFAAAQRA